jgi:hypothetical protein
MAEYMLLYVCVYCVLHMSILIFVYVHELFACLYLSVCAILCGHIFSAVCVCVCVCVCVNVCVFYVCAAPSVS